MFIKKIFFRCSEYEILKISYAIFVDFITRGYYLFLINFRKNTLYQKLNKFF